MESKHSNATHVTIYKGNLNKHIMSVHDRNKPFKCKLCKYAAFCKSDLKKNEISVHKKTKPLLESANIL